MPFELRETTCCSAAPAGEATAVATTVKVRSTRYRRIAELRSADRLEA
jgi:hypothetical protein